MGFVVYVIRSKSGKQYIGHTSDLDRRLVEHNTGLCKTTKVDTGWIVVYQEACSNRGEALKRERWLKTGVGREYLKKQIKASSGTDSH